MRQAKCHMVAQAGQPTFSLSFLPIIDTLFQMTESVSSPLRRSLDQGFRIDTIGFFYGVLVYGVWVEVFLCGWLWVFWWFHHLGIPIGLLVSWGLRYRLLWFWVFRWVLLRDLPMGLGWV